MKKRYEVLKYKDEILFEFFKFCFCAAWRVTNRAKRAVKSSVSAAKSSVSTKKRSYLYTPKNKSELRALISKLCGGSHVRRDLNSIDTSKITDMSGLFYNEG